MDRPCACVEQRIEGTQSVPRHNLSLVLFVSLHQKYGIPYLLTLRSLKHSLHLDVITFSQLILPPSAHRQCALILFWHFGAIYITYLLTYVDLAYHQHTSHVLYFQRYVRPANCSSLNLSWICELQWKKYDSRKAALILADRIMIHSMIGYWHHHVVCLSACLSVTLCIVVSGSVYRAKSCTSVSQASSYLSVPTLLL